MTLTEALPQLQEMAREEKLKLFEFLKKDLGLDEEWTHIAGVEAGVKMMEYLEQNAKAKV
ncbi:MAG: hypothetical protein FD167_3547 [bacterium]|nr:MAG: hypothetical protein FD167_3547 [bacterium]